MTLPGFNNFMDNNTANSTKPTFLGDSQPYPSYHLQHYFPPHTEHNNHLFSYPPPPPLIIPHPFDKDISPPRKRTRTTPEQLAVLEKSFSVNPSPNNRVREQLALQLGMPERSIQIWFQNRRAKVKNQAKRSLQSQENTLYMQQQYAASAAAAACQAAAAQQNQDAIDPNLYYYYYYYYFHQQQQQQQSSNSTPPVDEAKMDNLPHPTPSTSYSTPISWTPSFNTSMPDLTLSASTSSSSITSDRRRHHRSSSTSSGERTRAHSVGPYPYYRKSTPQERHSSMGPPTTTSNTTPLSNPVSGSSSLSSTPTSHQMMFGSYSDARLYNSSTILEEPYHIAPPASANPQKKFKLSAQGLQIGTWKRVSDLDCYIDLSTRILHWCIQGKQSFRMEININLVQFIRLLHDNKIEFFLSTPSQIKFFMTQGREWVQCHDFTQDKQATLENVHVLEGSDELNHEFMEILMQAPDLQSLVIQEDPLVANFYSHPESSQSFITNSSTQSLLLEDHPHDIETEKNMNTNLLLLQGLHLPQQ